MKILKTISAITLCMLVAVFFYACTKQDTQITASSTQTTAVTQPAVSWTNADSFKAPTEPATNKETPTDKGQADTAYALQRIENAHAVYDLFIGTKPTLDKTDSVPYENELEYYRISDKNLDTMAKLEAYVGKYFSEEITEKLLGIGLYAEIEGKLYAPDVGSSATNGIILDKSLEITEKTKAFESYSLTLMIDSNADGKVDSKQVKNFVCEPIGENGSWVFTKFEMY